MFQVMGYLIVLLGGVDQKIHVYLMKCDQAEKGLTFQTSLLGHTNAISTLKISSNLDHNKRLLASASKDGDIRLWTFGQHTSKQLSQDKQTYLINLSPEIIYFFHLETILHTHTDLVSSLDWGWFDPKKEHNEENLSLISASFDCSICIWGKDKDEGIWINSARLGQLGGEKNGFYGAMFNKSSTMIVGHTYVGAMYL